MDLCDLADSLSVSSDTALPSDVLRSIYLLPGELPADSYLPLLREWADSLSQDPLFSTSEEEKALLRSALVILQLPKCEGKQFKLFEEFGAAVVWSTSLTSISFNVIGLDNWEFTPCAGSAGAYPHVHYTAQSGRGLAIDCGRIPLESANAGEAIEEVFKSLSTLSIRNRRDKRQTPEVLARLLRCSTEAAATAKDVPLESQPNPPGGESTDVDRTKRPIAWPLLCQVMLYFIERAITAKENPSEAEEEDEVVTGHLRNSSASPSCPAISLFPRALANLHFHLTARYVHDLEPAHFSEVQKETFNAMLQTLLAAMDVVQERQEHTITPAMASRVKAMTARVRDVEEEKLRLLISESAISVIGKENYDLQLFSAPVCKEGVVSKASAQDRLAACVSSALPTELLAAGADPCTLRDYLNRVQGTKDNAMILSHSIEHVFFRLMANIMELEVKPEMASVMKDLALKFYPRYLQLSSSESPLAKSEDRSRRTLVCWIAFCFAHRAMLCSSSLDAIGRFGCVLRADDLRFLSTSRSKDAYDATQSVCAYLDSYRKATTESPFHPDASEALVALVDQLVAADSVRIKKRYEEEKKAAAEKEKRRFEKILKQKAEAQKCRAKIAQHESQEHSLREKISDLPVSWRLTSDQVTEQRVLQIRIDECRGKVSSLEQELAEHLKAPERIVQPYPRSEVDASRVIYLTEMPSLLQDYVELAYEGQGSLVETLSTRPLPWNRDAFFCWENHIPQNGGLRRSSFIKAYQNCSVPRQHGSTNVDYITEASDGSWYPPMQPPILLKDDRKCPFLSKSEDHMAYFTDKVEYQWMVNLDPFATDLKRSAMGMAKLSEKGNDITMNAFQHLSLIRCSPLDQLRKLTTELVRVNCSWSMKDVRTVVKMSVSQLAFPAISDRTPHWHLFESQGGFEELRLALQTAMEIIKEKDRDHTHLLMLSDVTTFLAAHYGPARAVARNFAQVALNWAMRFGEKLLKEEDISIRKRVEEKRLYGYALLFNDSPDLTSEDISGIVTAVTQLKNGYELAKQYFELNDSLKAELSYLYACSLNVLARRQREVIEQVKASPASLSRAIEQLFGVSPPGSAWSQYLQTSAFSAEDNGMVFFIDVLRGDALVDGSPPRTLPRSITSHELYRRTFGERNFDVRREGDTYITTTAIDGAEYSWRLIDAELRVVETYPSHSLILIPHDKEYGKQLPTLASTMCSHWKMSDSEITLARGINFKDRNVFYILHPSHKEDASATQSCVLSVVPPSMRSRPLEGLLNHRGEMDSFLSNKSLASAACVQKALLRLERDQALIHCLLTKDRMLRIHLPKFSITFDIQEDGTARAADAWKRFRLAEEQILAPWLMSFESYVILEEIKSGQRVVLMANGELTSEAGVYFMANPDCSLLRIDLHHRTGELHPSTNLARLVMASVAAAVRAPLQAIRLVRHSFTTAPLSDIEERALTTILKYTSHPALRLLCAQLRDGGHDFLHDRKPSEGRHDADAATLYDFHVRKSKYFADARGLLTPEEELDILGKNSLREASPLLGLHASLALEAPRSERPSSEFVSEKDDIITARLEPNQGDSSDAPEAGQCSFPLPIPANQTPLGEMQYEELIDSFTKHTKTKLSPEIHLSELKGLQRSYRAHKRLVSSKRELFQERVIASVLSLPTDGQLQSLHLMFDLYRHSKLDKSFSLEQIIRIALDLSLIRSLNPFLTSEACRSVRSIALEWMELCSLEDRLTQLIGLCEEGNVIQLEKTLRSRRLYDVHQHPRWLAFEVHTGLQIRPEQLEIAMKLIKNPGSITQLNMGEGKTRVIIPMLVLHFSTRCLTRVLVLSALLTEAHEYFHNTLTASVLQCPVYSMPFHRGRSLTAYAYLRLLKSTRQCRRAHGFLLVDPLHVLSLKLKLFDLQAPSQASETDVEAQNDEAQSLTALLNELKDCKDIIDESDEVLHHRVQLQYSYGRDQRLPSSRTRGIIAQAVLGALCKPPPSSALESLLSDKSLFVRQDFFDRPRGYYPELRCLYLANGKKSELCQELMKQLFNSPTHDLKWLKRLCSEAREAVCKAVCDTSVGFEEVLSSTSAHAFSELQKDQLLMLRGLLGQGLLFHSLSKRCNVDYGLREGKKRMAVPFRACDTPAERAEYSHPDSSILLTVLAHYCDGLTAEEVRTAITLLLNLGSIAQAQFYKEWIEPLLASDRPEYESIDRVEKLNIESRDQMELCARAFRYSVKAIDFYLNEQIFPRDTNVFPELTAASAWDLANENVIGFSGTNDQHLLLPLQVKQVYASDKLKGTNGRMVDVILRKTDELVRLLPQLEGKRTWESALTTVLDCAVECSALIDVGGVLAGSSAASIAQCVLDHGDGKRKAVLVFDRDSNQWLKVTKELSCPSNLSPIADAECFAVYDQSRCRGADLKLAEDAVAALLLGPDVCKDALMQGAGRMRKLEQKQRLVFFAQEEVLRSIGKEAAAGSPKASASSEEPSGEEKPLLTKGEDGDREEDGGRSSVTEVLQWVMNNTVVATGMGLLIWAQHGQYFGVTDARPSLRVMREKQSLKEMYAAPIEPMTAEQLIRQGHNQAIARMTLSAADVGENQEGSKGGEEQLSKKERLLMEGILERARAYGSHTLADRGADENECERELQKELEEQKETVRSWAPQLPAAEVDWNVASALHCLTAASASLSVPESLASFLHREIPQLADIPWPATIFCTQSFTARTIARSFNRSSATKASDILRIADAVLLFQDGTVLLLAPLEAERVLRQIQSDSRPTAARLYRVQQLRTAKPPFQSTPAISEETTTALLLFAGDTMFPARHSALNKLLSASKAHLAARALIAIRDTSRDLYRSDLEDCMHGSLSTDA